MPDVCCSAEHTVAPEGLGLLFMAGLAVSVGHCMGMCAPLLVGLFGATGQSRVRDVLAYHLGRVATYAAIGAVVGAVTATGGAVLGDLWPGPYVSLVAGGLVLLLGLAAIGVRGLGGLTRVSAGATSLPVIRRAMRWAHGRGPFALGVVNGLLPCGPVYLVAIAAAASSSALWASASMAAYGLGTVPALALVSVGAHRLGAAVRRRMAGVGVGFLMMVGVQLGLRGLASLGVLGHASVGRVVLW